MTEEIASLTSRQTDIVERVSGKARFVGQLVTGMKEMVQRETGKTHQLRLHMSSLGVPILGDTYYPVYRPSRGDDDFTDPLRLLARSLEFTDPITGAERRFDSNLALQF